MIKKIAVYTIFLLTGSLIVLLLMIVIRMANSGYRVPALLSKTATPIPTTLAPSPTHTPVPSETPTPEPTLTNTPLPPTATEKPVIEEGCYEVVFVADVTVPDGTEFQRNLAFTKTWRLQNGGTCTWTPSFKLYFHSGYQMSGPDSQQLTPVDVPPGKLIDVSVDLRSPDEAGVYGGNWAIKDEAGNSFGLGRYGNPFYVDILVVD